MVWFTDGFVWVLIYWLFCCGDFVHLLVLMLYLGCVACWFVLCVRVVGVLLLVFVNGVGLRFFCV